MKQVAIAFLLLGLLSLNAYSQNLTIKDSNGKLFQSYKPGDEVFFRFNIKKAIVIDSKILDTVLQVSIMATFDGGNKDYIYVSEITYANYILNGKHIFNNVAYNPSFDLLKLPEKIKLKDIGVVRVGKNKVKVNNNMIVENSSFINGQIELL